MKLRAFVQFFAGLLLCVLGFFLSRREPFEVHTVLSTAGGCQMATDFYEPPAGTPLGYVVLFHGLAANKKVMAFNAQEFANQGLRVFVPDLPGHGRTPGPFSPDRAESCAWALVQDLVARKTILLERTIFSGHSLGGAIAIRVAAKSPAAGVIAISPAPMHTAPGFSAEMVPFHDAPKLPPHSLVLTGEWEPGPIKSLAQQMVASADDASSKYEVIPRTSHVSVMFSAKTFGEIRSWTSELLATKSYSPFPTNMPALGCLLGILGLSILAPPFLREMHPAADLDPPSAPAPPSTLAWLGLALLALLLVRLSVPFSFLHLFQGDYLASYLFFAGLLVLILRRNAWPPLRDFLSPVSWSAAASALLLVLLFGAWFELTFYEAWPTTARWLRFPLLFLCFLPWHLGEELFLGEPATSPSIPRLAKAFALRTIFWAAILFGILLLHSGEILLFLLIAYFVTFAILQRLACDLVRFRTRSPAAAAIFGAILLAAFALAIFPVA
jgi:pimeloyl-ACP methyl ester carboxylesterase